MLVAIIISTFAAVGAITTEEIQIPHGKGPFAFALSMRGRTAFRIRVYAPMQPEPYVTPMVAPVEPDAPFQKIEAEDGMGIRSAIGSIIVTKKGQLKIWDIAGNILTQSEPLMTGPSSQLSLSTKGGKLYGRGAGPPDANSLTATLSDPMVCNRATYAPYYYSTDGYSALGVVNTTGPRIAHFGTRYEMSKKHIAWMFKRSFELYVMPATSLAEGTRAYYALIGAPLVLPRYAFGFSASRWGWKDHLYIDQTVQKFRQGNFPIDGIIVDFEWFTNESDYSYKPEGKPYYNDFGFNPVTFPNPKEDLEKLRYSSSIRMAGIRKPRLGNTKLLDQARAQGWILPNGEPAGSFPPDIEGAYAKDRNLDFSIAEVRQWYSANIAPLVRKGVSFWWNDEGESNYFTYHWWNVAQIDALRSVDPERRFYSLNRGWTPGMARLGAAVWTGDVDSSWNDLKGTPGIMLNWVLGGAPYVACDIGGFLGNTTGDQLTRWMQLGVFMPIMRVHSIIDATPHWPWLWGVPAAGAMRKALELRYRLVPYHYSLAHVQYRTQKPWIRPLAMEFPDDPKAKDITTQWMDGDLLVAPIVNQDSTRDIYLPVHNSGRGPRAGYWYRFVADSSAYSLLATGGSSFRGVADLSEMPVFVRPGTIVVLAPVVQHTGALPGGPLEVQVYAGADAMFDMFEDDGETMAYVAGQVRITHFVWNEDEMALSWTVSGAPSAGGKNSFDRLTVTLIDGEIYESSTWKVMADVGKLQMKGVSTNQLIV